MPYLLSATTVVSLALLTACSATRAIHPAQTQSLVDAPVVAMEPASARVKLTDLPRWAEHLRPRGDELSYQAIDWIPDFAEGVRAADARQLPMFFWAMNGHPLGST